jgi:phosphate uptake regulator
MRKDLGYRRIQRTGRGSYIISLPKEWINQMKLEKGNHIDFNLQEDSSLLLRPLKIIEGERESKLKELKEHIIVVESKDGAESINRKIISLYVNSADLIHIHFKKENISAAYKSSIRHLTKNLLLGAEIVKEESDKIIIQVLVSHPDFPLDIAIRRMTVLALSINRDAIIALSKKEKTIINAITETCNDVERLNLYVIRQLKYGLERNLFKELGFETPKEYLGYRIITNNIKSIANSASNIVHNIGSLQKMIEDGSLVLNETIDQELNSQILEFNSKAHSFFEDALGALFKRDYNRADQVISQSETFVEFETKLITIMSTKKMDPNISSIFRLIIDGSRQVIEYGRDIAEVTLNRTVEKTNPPL